MFTIEELKEYTTNILYLFKKDLIKDLKYYTKKNNNTMIQLTNSDIKRIDIILKLRGEIW